MKTGGIGSSGYKDNLTKSDVSMDIEHHQIHDGIHYFLSGFETAAISAEIDWIVTTAGTTNWAHMLFEFIGSDGIQFEVYEGSSGITGGTTITPLNSNRNSLNASGLTIVKDPTAQTDGTLIDSGSSGANNRIGIIGRENELILKQDTIYTFRVRSLGTGNIISHRAEWYETD